jgi:hypothetical protein
MAKGRKMQPTQRKLQMKERVAHSGAFRLLQVSDALSKVNRRLYRQGRNYRVKLQLPQALDGGSTEVYVLQDTWVNKLAWCKAFETYLNATKEEREMLGPRVARWHDFRVQYGSNAAFSGGVMDYAPLVKSPSLSDVLLTEGEFNNSTIQLDGADGTANDKGFWWDGSSATNFGLLSELQKLFNTDDAPTVIEVNQPYDGLKNEQMSLDDFKELQDEGNEPPYDATTFDNPWIRVDTLQISLGNGLRETDWFNAPCGLILIKDAAATTITMHVASGDYKGVHAPPMGVAKLTNDKVFKVR